MIIHKPSKLVFQNRLEAKLHFGSANYHRLMRNHHSDFLFTNDTTLFANNEYIYTNPQQNQPTDKKK